VLPIRWSPRLERAGAILLMAASAVALGASLAYGRWTRSEPTCCARSPSRARIGDAPATLVALRSPAANARTGVDDDMMWVPSGTFAMGSDDPSMPDARPWHEVDVDGFWMDRTEVTNDAFARFVEATGYETTAERETGDPLGPSGIVFSRPRTKWTSAMPCSGGSSFPAPIGAIRTPRARAGTHAAHKRAWIRTSRASPSA
jgi:formylglycine-generating enzyme required for sulfatase activity